MTKDADYSLEKYVELSEVKKFDRHGFDSCEVRWDGDHFLNLTFKQATALSEVAAWEKNGPGYILGSQPGDVDLPLINCAPSLRSIEGKYIHTTLQARIADYLPYKKKKDLKTEQKTASDYPIKKF